MELKGKYNTAQVYTDVIEQEAISQIIQLLNQGSMKESKIRIMPDCHAGEGCVIGTTMTVTDKVIPNLVGVDVGCGMRATKLSSNECDYAKLDNIIREFIPSGFDIHESAIRNMSEIDDIIAPIDKDRALRSIGSLGGGNHFIEVDRDKEGSLWLVVHTGSRNLGQKVCKHYQDLAYFEIRDKNITGKIKDTVAKLKAEGKERDIENTVKIIKMQGAPIPKDLCYVSGQSFEDYIHDMKITQRYAALNRETITDVIIEKMGFTKIESFDTIHNYIDTDKMILRKGAISAKIGEKVIIPMNMRDGSLICIGKGNDEWNQSAPHGAGRLMSRSRAKEQITMEEFKKSMEGIYSTSVNTSTLDESPMAYKPMESILDNIGDTVDVIDIIKPEYNFKAGDKK